VLIGQGKPSQPLAWVERGLALGKQRPFPFANLQLVYRRRGLLVQLGRGNDAIEEAWAEFREYPDKFRYEELMRFVPTAKRTTWHEKAMKAAERADLDRAIDLLLESNETARLVQRLEAASDAALEKISHYVTEPAAKYLAKTHPGVAARVFRALGMRILNTRKTNYYDAALSNLEAARRCYERAHLQPQWNMVVEEVRCEHLRKRSFMSGLPPATGEPRYHHRLIACENAGRRGSEAKGHCRSEGDRALFVWLPATECSAPRSSSRRTGESRSTSRPGSHPRRFRK
jgi:hypothetical protein